MKKFKKTLVLLLSILMIVALCPTGLAAEENTLVINSSGAIESYGSATYDFEDLTVSDSLVGPFPAKGTENPVFGTTDDNNAGADMKVVNAIDKNGNETKAMQLTNRTAWPAVSLAAKTITYSTSDIVEFSYDLCFDYLPDVANTHNAGTAFRIGGRNAFSSSIDVGAWTSGAQPPVMVHAGTKGYLEEGKWYTVVQRVVSHNGSGAVISYILDAQTEEVLITLNQASYNSGLLANGGSLVLYAVQMQRFAAGETDLPTCLLDNAQLKVYPAPSGSPKVISVNITDGQTGVPRKTEFKLVFDQKITGSAVLTKADGTGEVYLTTDVSEVFNTITLSYDGMLERNTQYKLSLSGIVNDDYDACTEDIIFTTEDLHIWNDIEISSVASGDTTEISFTISDDYNYPEFSGMVMAAAYTDGKMTGLDIVELTEVSTESELTRSFDIGSVSAGTEIQLMLLDNKYHPIPLASGKTEVQ